MSEDPIRKIRIKLSPTQILIISVSVVATVVVPRPPRPLRDGYVVIFGVNDQFVKVEFDLQGFKEDSANSTDGDMSRDPVREFGVKLSHTQILNIRVDVAATAVVPRPPRPLRDELVMFFRTDDDQVATIDVEMEQLMETVVVPNPANPGG